MVRNFDNRIEVTCPVIDRSIQKELQRMLDIQLKDNVKARVIGSGLPNEYRRSDSSPIRSQSEIYKYFKESLTDIQ